MSTARNRYLLGRIEQSVAQSRDRVIFHPAENQPVPLDQFQTYLNES